jgi:hypothetical protein
MIIAYLSTRYNSSGSASNEPKAERILFRSLFPLITLPSKFITLLREKEISHLNNILSDFNSLDADPKELYRVFKYASTPLNDNDIPLLNLY